MGIESWIKFGKPKRRNFRQIPKQEMLRVDVGVLLKGFRNASAAVARPFKQAIDRQLIDLWKAQYFSRTLLQGEGQSN